ncbi:MAG: MFS transporter [Gammaproteobacteria bacterium]|nr:MFS transporter [Gammaproteobacteria bacterium]
MTGRRPGNIRWIILALILAASFISYSLRTNMSIVAESMMNDLGFDTIQLGTIAAAFALGYAVFQFPGGILGTRFGARRVITTIAVIWGLLAIAVALVPGPDVMSVGAIVTTLVVIRFLVGVSHAPIFPCTSGGTIANWFPVGSWGLPNGLQSTGLTLGAAATAPLLVMLLEAYGWRQALLYTAPSAFVLAAVWWWYVRDYPKQHKSVDAAELALIDAGRPPPEAVETKGSWKVALANRNVLLLTISYFCMNYVFYLFFTWFFIYLVDVRGFPNQQAGLFTSAQWILGAVGATAGGFLCDRMIERYGFRYGPRRLSATSLVLCGVFLFAGAVSGNVTLAIVCLCLSFGCTQLTEASYWTAAISIAGRHAAEASGIMNTGGNLIGVFGGLMVPLIAEAFGWTAAVASGSIFAFTGAALWLFIRADEPMIESEAVAAPKAVHAG